MNSLNHLPRDKSMGRFANARLMSKSGPVSLNYLARKKEADRISGENEVFLRKLLDVAPHMSVRENFGYLKKSKISKSKRLRKEMFAFKSNQD